MLTKSNPGAVFALELRCERIGYLATENTNFDNLSSIRFLLDSLKVHHDTLRYPGMYQLMSFED